MGVGSVLRPVFDVAADVWFPGRCVFRHPGLRVVFELTLDLKLGCIRFSAVTHRLAVLKPIILDMACKTPSCALRSQDLASE